MRKVLAAAALLLPSACAPLAGAAGGAAAVTLLPQLPAWIASAATGVTVLSDTAQLACSIQTLANTTGDSEVSKVAGLLCSW